jgi:hypothetical protein
MYKVVYNDCFGGFSLSVEAVLWLRENGHGEIKTIAQTHKIERVERSYGCHLSGIDRHDPDLVRCVETLGERASGALANLKVYKLNGNRYRIDEYDGSEEVYEPEDEEYITIE